jgi:hypothetical protein
MRRSQKGYQVRETIANIEKRLIFGKNNLFCVLLKNMILQHITYIGSLDKNQVSKYVHVEKNKRFFNNAVKC